MRQGKYTDSNCIVDSLESFLTNNGYSFETLNMIKFNQFHVDHTIGAMLEKIYFREHSDEEIIAKVAKHKKDYCNIVYKTSICPFERLTNYSWDTMFNQVPLVAEYDGTLTHVTNVGIPLIISSTNYTRHGLYDNRNNGGVFLHLNYNRTQTEYVKINNIKYKYGESTIIVSRLPYFQQSPELRLYHPTIIIDYRLISEFIMQPEYPQVVKYLHTLYQLVSHDGIIHPLFQELVPEVREKLSADPKVRAMSKIHKVEMWEMNFIRMMRQIFETVCADYPLLKKGTMGLYNAINELTEYWEPTLRSYIRFIAEERITRLFALSVRPMIEKHQRCVGVIVGKDNEELVIPTDDYIYKMTHVHPESEALFHNPIDTSILHKISYQEITERMIAAYH